MSILDEILETKREEVDRLRASPGSAALAAAAADGPAPRGFERALLEGPMPRVIAEIKRASPSRGPIRADADAARTARAYEAAGAVALSVLTDRNWFGGRLEDLREARTAVSLPVLRKDFLIDPLQVLEARAAGADAVLLIVAALDDGRLRELLALAGELGMAALVEVHTASELDRARHAGATTLGINNRDLHTFKTDVEVTRGLLPRAAGCTVVSESGLADAGVVASLAREGVDAFLIGESLMQAEDPGKALASLREDACRS